MNLSAGVVWVDVQRPWTKCSPAGVPVNQAINTSGVDTYYQLHTPSYEGPMLVTRVAVVRAPVIACNGLLIAHHCKALLVLAMIAL